jgi:hypothetical protein
MKTIIWNLLTGVILFATSLQTLAQGSLIFDQQSMNPPSLLGDYFNIQTQPLTQSFIPTLPAVGFVQFQFWDISNNGNNGATVYVNLWAGSPNVNSATLLGSTTPVNMSNGFGSSFIGVTDFYFSSPVALDPGQTYYLQPVVLSGDNPWAIKVDGDSYSNGQLYGGGGFTAPFQPSVDLWFREGVVFVPEPSTLALVGLCIFLAFGFKYRRGLLLIAGLFVTTLASASQVYYLQSLGGVGSSPPLPMNLYGNSVSVEKISSGVYLVKDGAPVKKSNGFQTMSLSFPPFPGGGGTNGGGTNQLPSFDPIIHTNGLWLETSATNGINLGLRLHGTVAGDNYQLLSVSNLLNTNWNLGEILINAADDYTDFSPLLMTDAMTFYQAHHANPVMKIENVQDSIEPDSTNNDPGRVGIVYIQNEGTATNDVTVYYSIGGTAQNGIDYSNLTAAVTVPANQGWAEVDIAPIEAGFKPDQTVVLTLQQNTNYLIDPVYYSATNTLYANPQVFPVASGDIERVCPNMPASITLQARDPNNLPLTYTILTYPTHGALDTNALPYVTYTPTNCYEGQDSLTFKASNGQFDSAPFTVPLIIANPVYAYPVSPQTCRATAVNFALSGSDSCNETLSYSLLSNPVYGVLTGTLPNLTYTPTNANFTGVDSFNYAVFSACGGDAATNTVSITVGDANLDPIAQSVMTGTNRPVNILLSAADYYDSCTADTNYFAYNLTGSLTNGVLTGTPPNLTYTPTNGEGLDSFQFTVIDGVWTSSVPATVTIYVVAGPILANECNPFGTNVLLDWSLDNAVQQMRQQNGLVISDFIIYRSAVSGSNYTAIATNSATEMSYLDLTATSGQTNYYVVTFESYDSFTGVTYESPYSNEIGATGHNPDDLIASDAIWDVTDISDTNNPVHLGNKSAPFSSLYPNQYPELFPLPNTSWPTGSGGAYSTWTNHIALNISTNVDLSQVKYSVAIDNQCWLYVNGAYVGTRDNGGTFAVWSPFQSFGTSILHYGTNDIGVVIQDWGEINYFSMVVTTNTCGR